MSGIRPVNLVRQQSLVPQSSLATFVTTLRTFFLSASPLIHRTRPSTSAEYLQNSFKIIPENLQNIFRYLHHTFRIPSKYFQNTFKIHSKCFQNTSEYLHFFWIASDYLQNNFRRASEYLQNTFTIPS